MITIHPTASRTVLMILAVVLTALVLLPPSPASADYEDWACHYGGLNTSDVIGGRTIERSIPAKGLFNRILGREESRGEPWKYETHLFIRGRVSEFGGPLDRTGSRMGGDPDPRREGLALWADKKKKDLNTPLDPDADALANRAEEYYYIGMRWDYQPNVGGEQKFGWRRLRLLVVNPRNGKAAIVHPVDWGPHRDTKREIDLSPQVMKELGLVTDQDALVAFAPTKAPLGPAKCSGSGCGWSKDGTGRSVCECEGFRAEESHCGAKPKEEGPNGDLAETEFEYEINRRGGDYRNFALEKPQPSGCYLACRGDERCRAWTYVKPGRQGKEARCWLKNVVPADARDGCCVSGVMVGRGSSGSAAGARTTKAPPARNHPWEGLCFDEILKQGYRPLFAVSTITWTAHIFPDPVSNGHVSVAGCAKEPWDLQAFRRDFRMMDTKYHTVFPEQEVLQVRELQAPAKERVEVARLLPALSSLERQPTAGLESRAMRAPAAAELEGRQPRVQEPAALLLGQAEEHQHTAAPAGRGHHHEVRGTEFRTAPDRRHSAIDPPTLPKASSDPCRSLPNSLLCMGAIGVSPESTASPRVNVRDGLLRRVRAPGAAGRGPDRATGATGTP